MSKKIDWNQTYKDPFTKKLGSGKYSSGKELMQKAYQQDLQRKTAENDLQKMYPLMDHLLNVRFQNKTPIVVKHSINYQTSELVKGYSSSKFVDVMKNINPGTELIFKSLNQSMQFYVFEDKVGNEYEISFADKNKLMTCTDIYETVKNFVDSNQ